MIITYTDGTTQTVSAPAKEGNILEYMLLEDGTYGVYAGSEATNNAFITIPDTHNGAVVTQIMANGFKGLDKLQKVTFPANLVKIGSNAFNGCISLDNVTMPDTVTEIGNYAFNDCQSISALSFNAQLQSIGRYAFNGCSSLTSITIPASVTFIGKYSFYGTSLSYAKLENTEGWDFVNRDDLSVSHRDQSSVAPPTNENILFSNRYSAPHISYYYNFGLNQDLFIKRASATFSYSYYSSDGSTPIYCDFYKSDWIRK